MTTAAEVLAEVERHLLGGDREVINKLTNGIDADDTTFVCDRELGALGVGSYVTMDLEIMYVYAVANGTSTVSVDRGMLGSTAAAHSAGVQIKVDPMFPSAHVFSEVNAVIRSLSASGLFKVATFDLTTDAVARTYTVPAVTVDEILDVRWDRIGPENDWPRIGRERYELLRSMPTSEFANGLALRVDQMDLIPDRTLRVKYATNFTELTSLSSTLADVGLTTTMYDLPALGAAARLMASREAKRSFIERNETNRSQVASGSSARSSAVLMQLFNDRVRDEARRLHQQYPDRN